MTEREPGNDPRRTADALRQLIERVQTDASAETEADGSVVFYVLECGGVPQGIGGPYRAEPETKPGPEAEPEPEAEP